MGPLLVLNMIQSRGAYLLHVQHLPFGNEEVDGLILVKSETKNRFLKLLQHGKAL
jgi:hypothetical protein